MSVEGRIDEEVVEGIFGNGAIIMRCMHEVKQVFPLKDEQNQNVEKFRERNAA